jgi:hypothetical protein
LKEGVDRSGISYLIGMLVDGIEGLVFGSRDDDADGGWQLDSPKRIENNREYQLNRTIEYFKYFISIVSITRQNAIVL